MIWWVFINFIMFLIVVLSLIVMWDWFLYRGMMLGLYLDEFKRCLNSFVFCGFIIWLKYVLNSVIIVNIEVYCVIILFVCVCLIILYFIVCI